MRVLFIADQFADVNRTESDRYPGGAELTDQGAIDACPGDIDCVKCTDVVLEDLASYDVHILGNTQHARPELYEALSDLGRHILFEHDVRICHWRGNFSVLVEPTHRIFQRCTCPHPQLRGLYDTALGAIFLTHRQLAVFEHNPFFRVRATRVLGCSIFTDDLFDRVGKPAQTREGTVYFDSRARIKGAENAREYALKRGWNPRPIRDLTPPQVLDVFASAKRFVYLPLGLEPAGRMVAEARVLGCEVVVNDHVGVCGESWWHLPTSEATQVLRDAPHRFWRLVDDLANQTNAPRPPRLSAKQRRLSISSSKESSQLNDVDRVR